MAARGTEHGMAWRVASTRRHVLRRGVTLVELMIAMLILTIVCLSWLEIIGIQSARKEARRREAVERLAGMMDAFMYCYQNVSASACGYQVMTNGNAIAWSEDTTSNMVYPMFEAGVSPIGYQLSVVNKSALPDAAKFGDNWSGKWLVGRLYDHNGNVNEVGKPFFTLPVCLGL